MRKCICFVLSYLVYGTLLWQPLQTSTNNLEVGSKTETLIEGKKEEAGVEKSETMDFYSMP
jgi:hypothetical protein